MTSTVGPFAGSPSRTVALRLPPIMLRAAVLDCVMDRKPLDETVTALWREDPGNIEAVYVAVVERRDRRVEGDTEEGRHGLLAERMKELRRPLLARGKQGITITELSERAGFDRETVACALEHHGFVELVPYGGRKRRRMVTEKAERAGLGHNPDGGNSHVGHLEGFAKAVPFPVFYPEHVDSILWSLDLPGIRDAAAAIQKKRARLRWLLDHHGYLPNQAVADFAGCTSRAVEKARARDLESSVVRYRTKS